MQIAQAGMLLSASLHRAYVYCGGSMLFAPAWWQSIDSQLYCTLLVDQLDCVWSQALFCFSFTSCYVYIAIFTAHLQ